MASVCEGSGGEGGGGAGNYNILSKMKPLLRVCIDFRTRRWRITSYIIIDLCLLVSGNFASMTMLTSLDKLMG